MRRKEKESEKHMIKDNLTSLVPTAFLVYDKDEEWEKLEKTMV